MKIFKRLHKLWELSRDVGEPVNEPTQHSFEEEKIPELEIKEVFIPRITRDPVKEITTEQP